MDYREEHFTAQDGLRLYFRDYGDGGTSALPVLCLPGLTRNSADFDGLARRLSSQRRVVCPDYRGRGRSDYDTDWRNYTPRTILNDVRHLLAVTGIHRVAVIGTSFGGLLGMGLAVAAPTALAGLVINDIGPDINVAETRRLLTLLGADRPQPDWNGAIAAIRDMFPTLNFRDPALWPVMARNTYREGADGRLHFDWDTELVRPLLRNREPPDLWTLYRALRRIPVLAVRGENSPMLSAQCFDRMAVEKPDLVRLTIAGAGHAPTLDEAESRDAIDNFLDRL
ncbi:MAG: alpha/beta fold hydrolase [Alphaproteobacteria bacterium]